MTDFAELVGKTLHKIDNLDDHLDFETTEGERYQMYHSQDCCESVRLEEVIGDLKDLLGSPILQAESVSGDGKTETPPDGADAKLYAGSDDEVTWTFYKLATIKGSVTLRWLGESNGCYSTKVSFVKI